MEIPSPRTKAAPPQDGGRQTIFLLNPVSSTQAGTHRCYGAFHDNPYVWYQPSDPLQPLVEGEEEAQSTHLLPALGTDSAVKALAGEEDHKREGV